jgi:hypothetical protein
MITESIAPTLVVFRKRPRATCVLPPYCPIFPGRSLLSGLSRATSIAIVNTNLKVMKVER